MRLKNHCILNKYYASGRSEDLGKAKTYRKIICAGLYLRQPLVMIHPIPPFQGDIMPRFSHSPSWFLSAMLLALAACTPPAHTIASAKVVGVGQKNLILDDGESVMFVSIDPSDRERLSRLHKGDKVELLGKEEKAGKDEKERSGETSGGHAALAEIDELVTEDGTHIPLGEHP